MGAIDTAEIETAERERLLFEVRGALHARKPDVAEGVLRHLLARAPDDEAALRLADLLHEAGRLEDAMAVLSRFLDRAPGSGPGHHLAAIVAFDRGDLDAALIYAGRATTLLPRSAACWSNLGMILKTQGAFDKSLAAHCAAVCAEPDDPQFRLNRAVALLRAGRMREAWPDYEHRLRVPTGAGPARLPPERLLPAVDTLDLAGRIVLVAHEEGFGDTLQFLRYVPMLAARGARVFAWMPPELVRLVRGTPGLAHVFSGDGALPPHDYHCPVFSLPRAFATDLATIPAGAPYLAADRALVAAWAAKLPPKQGLRVGLVWAGQARPWLAGFTALDRRRSTTLDTLAPITAVGGVQFVALQKGAAPDAGSALFDPMAEVTDFADTAAIVAQLDLVISVDTAVAHLAGGLGVPVFLLDRYDSCWRWFAGREDSPWYPKLRIFRQERMGVWDAPVAGIRAALAALRG